MKSYGGHEGRRPTAVKDMNQQILRQGNQRTTSLSQFYTLTHKARAWFTNGLAPHPEVRGWAKSHQETAGGPALRNRPSLSPSSPGFD